MSSSCASLQCQHGLRECQQLVLISIRHVFISNGRRWIIHIIISPTVWMGRAMAPPSNFASFSGADLALAADVTTAFCPYMQERQIQLVFAGCRHDLIARGAAFRVSSIQQRRDHLHCGEDGISLKTLRYRQSLPPTAGLLSGPLVAAQASTQTSEAFA